MLMRNDKYPGYHDYQKVLIDYVNNREKQPLQRRDSGADSTTDNIKNRCMMYETREQTYS